MAYPVSGEFGEAKFNENYGYLHQSSLQYCIPIVTLHLPEITAGKIKVRPLGAFRLYPKPSQRSLPRTTVKVGSTLFIGEKQNEFYEVAYKNRLRYMHESSYQFCEPSDTALPELSLIDDVTPLVEDLKTARKLMLWSLAIPSMGALIGGIVIITEPYGILPNTDFGELIPTVIIYSSLVAGAACYTNAYHKIKKAAANLSFTPASSGIGLAFNLK